MTKLVVLAVLVLAAVAAADTIRPQAKERPLSQAGVDLHQIRHPVRSSGFEPAGSPVRNRVLFRGREFLSPGEIADGFPAPSPVSFFQIAHLAAHSDGTLVLAVYGFPPGGKDADAIQVWRHGRLESSFLVRAGTFGGGIGFADDGRLIAALSPDGLVVNLFTRSGRPVGRQSATSW